MVTAEALLFPSCPGSMGPYLLRSYLCVLVGSWSRLLEVQEAQVGNQGCGGWPRGWGLPPRELPLSPSLSIASLNIFPFCCLSSAYSP